MEKPSKNVSNLVELRQASLVSMLAAGKTVAEVARESGVSQKHLYYLCSRASNLLGDAVSEAHSRIRARLPDLISLALDTLEQQLTKGDADRKHRAAKTVLSVAARMSSPAQCDACIHRIINQ